MDHRDTNWRACYAQLAPKLVLFARQWVHVMADAEDVVQNAFVKFWRHQPDAGPEHYPLLYSAVRSCALDFLRGSARRVRRENDDRVSVPRGDAPFFDTTLDQRDTTDTLEAALLRLPEPQREVLVLHLWGELTFADIAATLGESSNTVASRYRYGLEALRRIVKPTQYERV